jgi:hypothetical protein
MLTGAVKQLIGRVLLQRHRRAWHAEPRLERERLAPGYWDTEIGPDWRLAVQGVDLARVADESGTPLHVVDTARLRANYHGFLEAFDGIRPGTPRDFLQDQTCAFAVELSRPPPDRCATATLAIECRNPLAEALARLWRAGRALSGLVNRSS